MTETADLTVVGAGPAGLAAAVAGADEGLSVVLVDAAGQPGGQYWRHPDRAHTAGQHERSELHDRRRFASLRNRLGAHEREGRIRYLRRTQVWLVERDGTGWSLRLSSVAAGGSDADRVRSEQLILCPGGYDRQLPVPGWTLPGVMAAGGVQAMLTANRVRPGQRAVVAGTGPFLLSVATALARQGVEVAAICDANPPSAWLGDLRGALSEPAKLVEGAGYALALARHRIRYRAGWAVIAVHGTGRAEAVTISRLGPEGARGHGERIAVDLVALGWGFTPSLELAIAAGVGTRVDRDGSLVAVVDEDQRSGVAGVSLAGEVTGIGGAMLAVREGELAALAIAHERAAAEGRALAGVAARERRIRHLRTAVRRGRGFAAALHRATPVPAGWSAWLQDDTLICRCEEVPFRDVRYARDELGAADGRTVRSLTRCGMGWCQGRVCGFALARLAAPGAEPDPQHLRQLGSRAIATPVSLGTLASLAADQPAPDRDDPGRRRRHRP